MGFVDEECVLRVTDVDSNALSVHDRLDEGGTTMTLAWRSNLLTGAEAAAIAACSLRLRLGEALQSLRAAQREVDPDLKIELEQTISVVRQAYDHTEEFERLYTTLPERVAELNKTAVSLEFAKKRLRGFRRDLGRVNYWEGAINTHLGTAKKLLAKVLDPGPYAVQAVSWRDLRTNAGEQVAQAEKDLTQLSDSSARVLRELGFGADLMEGQGKL